MDQGDWKTYLHSALPGLSPSTEIQIDKLTGGVVNSTVRVTFPSGFALGPSSRTEADAGLAASLTNVSISQDGTAPTSPPTSAPASFVLKHAPSHMPNDPETPLSQFRQTAEARALVHLKTDAALVGALANTGVRVPELVWHDTVRHVLWITDLGPMITLSTFLDGEGGEIDGDSSAGVHQDVSITYAHDVGHTLGRTVGLLHLAARSPAPDLAQCFKDPAPVGPGVGGYLQTAARTQLGTYDLDKALADRIGLDISAPLQDGLAVWGMSDFWPGSVLLSPTPTLKEGARTDAGAVEARDVTMALVDWEFATVDHPGSEVGMMLAHIQGHALRAAHPVIPPPAQDTAGSTTSETEPRTESGTEKEKETRPAGGDGGAPPRPPQRALLGRINAVAAGFVDGYTRTAPAFVRSGSFARAALQAFGREMVVGPDFEPDIWSPAGHARAVRLGAACLRAAGTADEEVDWKKVVDGTRPLEEEDGTREELFIAMLTTAS